VVVEEALYEFKVVKRRGLTQGLWKFR